MCASSLSNAPVLGAFDEPADAAKWDAPAAPKWDADADADAHISTTFSNI